MKQLEFTVKRSRKQYVAEESARQAKAGMTEHDARKETRERDLAALKALQVARPMRPPGGR